MAFSTPTVYQTNAPQWTGDPAADPRLHLYDYLGQSAGDPNATGQTVGDPSSDPNLSWLVSNGYLTQTAGGGSDGGGSGSGWQLGGSAPSYLADNFRPQGITGQDHAIDPSQVVKDPTYGTITDTRNIYHPSEHDAMQKYIQPAMEMALSMGMGGAIGMVDPEMAGAGMFGGSDGLEGADPSSWMNIGQKAQGALGSDNGPSLNPSSLFGMGIGAAGSALGIPSGVSQYAPTIMNLLQGGKINPIQMAMMLSRGLGGSQGGGS